MIFLLIILFWTSLAVLFYCYVGYGITAMLLVGLKTLFTPRKKQYISVSQLPVTMIITVYNEEKILEEKIANLFSLDYPAGQLKFIFVTDGSDDQSMNIVSNYPSILLLHHAERKGKYSAIKHAMQFVDSPVVVFSDANTMLNRDAIKRMVSHYQDDQVGGVAGEKKIIVNRESSAVGQGEGMYWQYESFMKKLDARLYTVIGAAGELFSIRTHLFKDFPDDLIIEDFIISMQVCLQGYKISYEPKAFAAELPSASIAEEEKRKVRISAGAYQSIGYLKGCLNFWQHPMLSFQYLSRRLLRWLFCPILLIIFFIANFFIVIMNPTAFFSGMLSLQTIFYAMAFIGLILVNQNKKAGLFTVPFYFVFMNYCLVKGFFRFLKGRQSVLLEKSLRQAA